MDQKVCTFNVNYLPLCFGYMRTFEMLFENLHLHSFYYVVQMITYLKCIGFSQRDKCMINTWREKCTYSVSHNIFAFSIGVLRQFRLGDHKIILAR